MRIYHPKQIWLNCLDNPCTKFGKHYVPLLRENTIWSEYGILAVRTGLMSISIAEGGKLFAAYTQKEIALVS